MYLLGKESARARERERKREDDHLLSFRYRPVMLSHTDKEALILDLAALISTPAE